MNWTLLTPLLTISAYFGVLMLISYFTSRNATSDAYFLGNKNSPWFIVAFGMIGDSLSGVTFVSVPGEVGVQGFAYLQIVLGYMLGYWVIAKVLLPLYYRLNITSIYSYLGQRFGKTAQQTGSVFFLLSRTIGAAFRLFISAGVMQVFLFQHLGIPFALTVSIIIILILLYTLKGGIKTLVWTDTFQSLFLLMGVILTAVAILNRLDWSIGEAYTQIAESRFSSIWVWDPKSKLYVFKQLVSGMFIAIAMTGLDQNMMQKNLSCKSLKDAQKNMYWFSVIVVIVNVVFLALGALMYLMAEQNNIAIPAKTDTFLPILAQSYLGTTAAVVFLLGITAATFSSADSVLTTLTTSFYIDVLHLDKSKIGEDKLKRTRNLIHAGFALSLLLVILLFEAINDGTVISGIFTAAGYTYGPLIGLFAFGIFTQRQIQSNAVWLVCIAAPLLSFLLSSNSKVVFSGYQIGFELLLINGLLTFAGLWIFSKQKENTFQ